MAAPYWVPTTKVGRIGLWLMICCFAGIFLNYWIAMLAGISIHFIPAAVLVIGVLAGGFLSAVAIFKHRDTAVLPYISVVIGCLVLLFVLGEILFPH